MPERKGQLAFVIPSLGDGGSNRFVIKVAAGLAKRGYRVDLIAIDPRGQYASETTAGLRRIDLGIIPIKGMTLLKAIWSLKKYIQNERPNVLMAATTSVNILAVTANFLARNTTSVVVSERSPIKASAVDASTMSRLYRRLIPTVYPRAAKVIAVSKGVADELISSYQIDSKLVSVIYNPVVSKDIDRLKDKPVNEPWLQESTIPVVLAVGRLHPAKDFSTLIRGFAVLRSRIEARLIILGEGRCRLDLQELVAELGLQDSVRIPGFVENPYAYMSRANVLAMTSVYEGICNVVIEALACGCPVVATDCTGGGPREVLEHGKWGALIPTKDPRQLSEALATALTSEHEPENYMQRAAYFSVESSLDKYQELFSALR